MIRPSIPTLRTGRTERRQAYVFAPGGLLSRSNVSEHRVSVVVESGSVYFSDGPEFSDDWSLGDVFRAGQFYLVLWLLKQSVLLIQLAGKGHKWWRHGGRARIPSSG